MGPYAEVDYNFNLISTPESTPTHGNPMPESTLALCQSRLYPPVGDFGFGLWMVPTGAGVQMPANITLAQQYLQHLQLCIFCLIFMS
jgi:hypothetical protein